MKKIPITAESIDQVGNFLADLNTKCQEHIKKFPKFYRDSFFCR